MKKKVLMVVLSVFSLALLVYGLSLRSEYLLAEGVKQNIKMKRYEVALNDLEKAKTGLSSWASRLVKDSRVLRDYNEGVAQFLLGESELAAACFKKARSTSRSVLKKRVLYNQANILVMNGDFIGAIEKYEEVLVIDPDDSQAKTNLELIRAIQEKASQMDPSQQEGKRGRLKDLRLLLEGGEPEGETPSQEKRW